MASSYKIIDCKGLLSEALSSLSDLEALRDEMREWADNMSSNNMGHLDKYQEVEDCANGLDGVDNVDLTLPAGVEDVEITWHEARNRRKGRGESRAIRRDNAVAALQAAKEHIEDAHEEGKRTDEVNQFLSDLQDLIDEAEGVDFPGMY